LNRKERRRKSRKKRYMNVVILQLPSVIHIYFLNRCFIKGWALGKFTADCEDDFAYLVFSRTFFLYSSNSFAHLIALTIRTVLNRLVVRQKSTTVRNINKLIWEKCGAIRLVLKAASWILNIQYCQI